MRTGALWNLENPKGGIKSEMRRWIHKHNRTGIVYKGMKRIILYMPTEGDEVGNSTVDQEMLASGTIAGPCSTAFALSFDHR